MKLPVRTWISGLLVIALALWALTPAALPARAAGPTLSVSPPAAAPGDTVVVGGAGFHPGGTAVVTATFYVAGAAHPVQAAAAVASNGSFSAQLKIPAGTGPGIYSIHARDFRGSTASTVLRMLRLLALRPGTQAPKVSVDANQDLFVQGSGFAAHENVTLTVAFPRYNGTTTLVNLTKTTDQNGNFSRVVVHVPADAKQGNTTVTAKGQASGKTATGTIYATYHPYVALASAAARPGGQFVLNGQGFVPNSQVSVSYTFARNGSSPATLSQTVNTNASGQFSVSLSLPQNAKSGTYRVAATDVTGGFRALTSLIISVKPVITVAPSGVQPGGTLVVKGSGYGAHVPVTVQTTFPLYTGGNHAAGVTAYTDANGNFTAHLAVPTNAQAATVTLTASGPNAAAHTQFVIGHIKSGIAITPGSANAGSTISVSGAGYLAGSRVVISVNVTLTSGAKQTLTANATANSSGRFAASIHLPANVNSGTYTATAHSLTSGRVRSAQFRVLHYAPSITAAPGSVVPGSTVTFRGSGYVPGSPIQVSFVITLANGTKQTVAGSTTTNAQGTFSTSIRVPVGAAGGAYTATARNTATGRTAAARFNVVKLAPSIVVAPVTAAPGTQVTLSGFGFAPGQTIAITLGNQKLGAATTNASGQFSLKVTIPSGLASNAYTFTARSTSGRTATIGVTVQRLVSTHFYFAAFYTGRGYSESMAFLNPSAIQARVNILYQPTTGATKSKSIVVAPHSRFTENVNADLGYHVSAGATISADVPITASAIVYHGSDMAVVPGATRPSTSWYFADGNTGRGYREFVAIQNPNRVPVQVAVHFLPTHHRQFTIYRTIPATAKTTVKVNSYIKRDAVGVIVTSNSPVVANRSIFIHHGTTSKIGVMQPQARWYFAAGPGNTRARHWIGAINPSNRSTYVTVHAYGVNGSELGTVHTWLRPYARIGYLMNRIAHTTDVAVALTASQPVVAEQTTYSGRMHNDSTDTFGVSQPGKAWGFAAVDTTNGHDSVLSLFNPGLTSMPIVVQFITSNGAVMQRTYVVAPLAHQRIDVGSVEPNAQLGVVASSDAPFVAMNRTFANFRLASDTSEGVPL